MKTEESIKEKVMRLKDDLKGLQSTVQELQLQTHLAIIDSHKIRRVENDVRNSISPQYQIACKLKAETAWATILQKYSF